MFVKRLRSIMALVILLALMAACGQAAPTEAPAP
jgi:predicted small lipoprotein YifL